MRVLNLNTTLEPLTNLKPHPQNPRRGNTPAIRDSINHAGFYGTIIVQKTTGFILAGNHRYLAAQEAGAAEIPVTWVDVDDDHALKILLADNRTSDLSTYNDTALADLLQTVNTDTTLTGTGYDDTDLQNLLNHLTEPFTPTPATHTTPTHRATPETVATAKEQLTDHYTTGKDLHPAMCPNCGTEFYVD